MTELQSAVEPPPSSPPPSFLHPRREIFEHGLLPIPKLVFTDPTQTLMQLKSKLSSSSNDQGRIGTQNLAQALQIPIEHSRLVIETLAGVLPDESDPIVKARVSSEVDEIGVDLFDLLVFLYVQGYKRLVPKGHRDSASVADVWPSTSAFDGFLSALSPLQLLRSNSRRFMPSADEEAHQLSYLQKHLRNIISLLADSAEGEGDESVLLSMGKFEHLGLLIYFGERRADWTPLSQNTPFFANSDPDMPAAPVSASLVLEWLIQNVSSTQEHISDRGSPKENGQSSSLDQDVTMSDVTKPPNNSRGCQLPRICHLRIGTSEIRNSLWVL